MILASLAWVAITAALTLAALHDREAAWGLLATIALIITIATGAEALRTRKARE